MLLKNFKTNQNISDWRDWTPLKKKEHWKAGRSSMELARAWFTSATPTVPKEIQELLATNPRTARIGFTEGFPEYVTSLPERGEGRNHDLMLRGQANNEKVVVCVEAKVDEPFGSTIGAYWEKGKESATPTKAPERIEALLKIAFGADAQTEQSLWHDLRYQLLTGIAGTALQAARDNAPLAVFIAHEFHTATTKQKFLATNAGDYAKFVACFCSIPMNTVTSGTLYGPVSLRLALVEQGKSIWRDVDVFVGKAFTVIG